jgi:type VI secretion system protein ImpK
MSYSLQETIVSNNTPGGILLTQLNANFPINFSQKQVHQANVGINPIVDAAAYIFSILNRLKNLKTYPSLIQLHQELRDEINNFQLTIQTLGYPTDLVIVCRYVLCATIDDIIPRNHWGGQWPSLLEAFKLDLNHETRFFAILERSIQDPSSYIDLMELIYLCLNAGYKGQYRDSDHNHYQLEQITNSLYQHIRAYRGNISKNLSSTSLKPIKHHAAITNSKTSISFIIISAACVIMTIFISLSYLMDIISNEAFEQISELKVPNSKIITQK